MQCSNPCYIPRNTGWSLGILIRIKLSTFLLLYRWLDSCWSMFNPKPTPANYPMILATEHRALWTLSSTLIKLQIDGHTKRSLHDCRDSWNGNDDHLQPPVVKSMGVKIPRGPVHEIVIVDGFVAFGKMVPSFGWWICQSRCHFLRWWEIWTSNN